MGSTTSPTSTLPYWQTNLPATAPLPSTCPPYLQNLGAKDISILSTPDSAYHTLTWAEVRTIIAQNRLDLFQRVPSDLRRYLEYNYGTKLKYGSVMAFVLREKLGWVGGAEEGGGGGEENGNGLLPLGGPFEVPSDVSVKWNDWPYGLDKRIVHLVVWTKFELEDDVVTGDLRDDVRALIDKYVDETFCSRVGKENVIWFKNWKSLKSVHAVEHFHVMMFDPDPAFVREITNGDEPISSKV